MAIFGQINIDVFSFNFFQFLVINTLDLDPDPYSPKILDYWIRIHIETSADPKQRISIEH
jgi:hypothetical protein